MDPIQLSPGARVHLHACGEEGIFVNAYLVETDSGVVAVDATLTVSTGRALRARLEALGKPLLGVLVTHPHPDHVAGLAELVSDDALPIFATDPVVALMRRLEAPKRAQWGPVFKDEWVPRWRYPNRIVADGEVVTLGGVAFRVHDLGRGGDSDANAMWVAAEAAFVGDLVFDGVHAYLADGGVLAWLANLERVARMGLARLFPGHGPPGAPAELIPRQRDYLLAYAAHVKELAGGRGALDDAGRAELARRMDAHRPGAGLAFLVGMSADAVAAELARGG
ncbi:MAG TPA: MBL fold metallo-hydrolase [Haliangiales bacterium]|nr:MBL fold metallo-hydrolase [Haliangiales bacterium]